MAVLSQNFRPSLLQVLLRQGVASVILTSSLRHARPRLSLSVRKRTCETSKYRSMSTTSLDEEEDAAPCIEYDWVDGVERLELYKPGGYHPIMLDDVLNCRYRIIDKLGYGGYSTIWLAHDNQTKRMITLKVGVANDAPISREASILRSLSQIPIQCQPLHSKLQAQAFIPEVQDEFMLQGPNGSHSCYTVATAQGDLKSASFSRLFPIQVSRALSAGVAVAVSLVHSRGYVHGDIHLRNILVKQPAEFGELSVEQFRSKFDEPEAENVTRADGKPLPPNVPLQVVVPLYMGKRAQEFTLADAGGILLNDFGEAFAPATEQRLGKNCKTPIPIRPPETLFEPEVPLSYPSDIWNLALVIWEIAGMKFLFSESGNEYEVAAQQIDVLGRNGFPKKWWKQLQGSEAQDYVSAEDRDVWPVLEQAFEEFVQKYRREQATLGEFGPEETKAFLKLMRGMLRFRPEERLTIEGVLQSDWMTKWALPDLEQSQKVIAAHADS